MKVSAIQCVKPRPVLHYSIFAGKTHNLVRIRNPWGNKAEWTGEWSDEKMQSLPDNIKEEYGIVDEDDGEFYMSMKDVLKQFDSISICHVLNDYLAAYENSVDFNSTVSTETFRSTLNHSAYYFFYLGILPFE